MTPLRLAWANLIHKRTRTLLAAAGVGADGVFPSAEAARAAGTKLTRADAFLLDRRSKPEFGDVSKLERTPLSGRGQDAIRVNDQRAEIVGGFELGTGFSWNGMLMS